jgi:hypothetical protein
MLCGIGLGFDLLLSDVLGCVSDQRNSKDREQPISF